MATVTRTEQNVVIPDAEEVRLLADLATLLHDMPDEEVRLVGPDAEAVSLSASAVTVLRRVVDYLANGRGVSVVPIDRELTTQQAADLLQVSRPYLIGLLEKGEIPFSKVGSHRRVRLDDVIAYARAEAIRRREALRELTRLSEEIGLYDLEDQAS